MRCNTSVRHDDRPCGVRRRSAAREATPAGPALNLPSGRYRRRQLLQLVAAASLLAVNGAWAQALAPVDVDLNSLSATRTEDGLLLSFALSFTLPELVEDALQKGIPLNFVAEATLYRSRWYWRDQRVSRVSRTWRLAYQPLTRQYRVSFGGLSQPFDNLHDAVASVRRATDWRIGPSPDPQDGAAHYVEFSYRLDTTLLPRPMQIGIGGQPEWNLQLEQTVRIN